MAIKFANLSLAERQKQVCFCCDTCCGFNVHGDYRRQAVYADGKQDTVSIPRYKCVVKNVERKGATFSLIDCDLIPYAQYAISFLIICVIHVLESSKKTLAAKLSDMASLFKDRDYAVNMDSSHFNYLRHIAEYSWQRVRILKQDVRIFNRNYGEDLLSFLHYCQSVHDPPEHSASKLNLETFAQTSYFLFGTSSQHRKRYV